MSQFGWKPLEVVPPVPRERSYQAIGAWKNKKGNWYVGEVHYLNGMQLENLEGGPDEYIYPVGWHTLNDDDGEERYDSIDILFWQEMPAPPTQETP